jgi:hypothetical protein
VGVFLAPTGIEGRVDLDQIDVFSLHLLPYGQVITEIARVFHHPLSYSSLKH